MLEWTRTALDRAAGIELPETPDRLPWFLQGLGGIIAWVAASFGLCFSAICFGEVQGLWGPLGVLIALVSTVLARGAGVLPDLLDVAVGQLGLIGSIMARLLLVGAGAQLLGGVQSALLLSAFVELGFVVLFPQTLQRTYSGVAIPSLLLGALGTDLAPREILGASAAAAALAGAWLLPHLEPTLIRLEPGRSLGAASGLDLRVLSNAIEPVCRGLVIFVFGLEALRFAEPAGRVGVALGLGYGLLGLAVVAALVVRHDLRGRALAAAAIGGVLLVPMGAFVPALPLTVAFLLVGVERRNSLLVGMAIGGAFLCGGLLYYQLHLTLATKGLVLIGSGLLALGLRWFVQDRRGHATPARSAPAVAGVLGATMLTLGIIAFQMGRAEWVVSTGQPVFLELAPVDPRSLVQGDYMRLRYALDGDASALGRGWAEATLDSRGVVTAIGPDRGTPGAVRLKLRSVSGRASPIATSAYLFQEGTAEAYEDAEFGAFRVRDGKLVLVALTDADLKPLGSARGRW